MNLWYEKDGVKKLFNEEPTEKGWERCAGHYDFAIGQWIEHPVAAEGKEELNGLRAEYKKKFGKKPFNGWDVDKLYEKLNG